MTLERATSTVEIIFASPPIHDTVGATKLSVAFAVATLCNNLLACAAASFFKREEAPTLLACLEQRSAVCRIIQYHPATMTDETVGRDRFVGAIYASFEWVLETTLGLLKRSMNNA